MKIAIGADHAGFELKELLRASLADSGHCVRDLGTHSKESIDYPDYARAVASEVAAGDAEMGILVCSSGGGMAIAANKIHGIRAALGVHNEQVKLLRQHNNANVLTLGASFTAAPEAAMLVKTFLETGFEGGRHARRVDKITTMDSGNLESKETK
jgi:ribose 5-phosphate isomerase B